MKQPPIFPKLSLEWLQKGKLYIFLHNIDISSGSRNIKEIGKSIRFSCGMNCFKSVAKYGKRNTYWPVALNIIDNPALYSHMKLEVLIKEWEKLSAEQKAEYEKRAKYGPYPEDVMKRRLKGVIDNILEQVRQFYRRFLG